MYRLFILAAFLTFLSVSSASECLPHVCYASFQACNSTGHNTQECWDWADDVFNCCDECGLCDSASKHTRSKKWERDCSPHLCDTVFDICKHVHSDNTTDCLERADHAAHCCYSCLDCPTTHHTKFPRYLKPKSDQCAAKFCNAVYDACTETGHDSKKCKEVADDASHCCDACGTCNAQDKIKEPVNECRANMCNTIFDVCNHVHSTNSTECQERADVATDCCYNCLECPSNVRPTLKYDHCLSNLCDDVFKVCTQTDHSPDECREAANAASQCCNMCNDCH